MKVYTNKFPIGRTGPLLALILLLSLLVACGDSTGTAVPAATTTQAVVPTQAATTAPQAATTQAGSGTTAAAATPASGNRQAVTLALSYIPDVQFAPYYVAQDKGYFSQEGLEVTFQHGTIDNMMALVGQGKIGFALASGDEVIQARAGGIPVKTVATQYQKYPVALASLKGKGITTPASLKGKTIGIPGQFGSTYIGFKALLAAGKLTEEDVKVVTIGFTQREALSQSKVDGAMVYSMNEPVQLARAGVALDILEVSGINNLASVGLITSENTISTNPQVVQKMTRAVQRGIRDTLANPDAAFDSTVKVAPDAMGTNPDLQRQVLKETLKFMVSDSVKGQPYGYTDPKLWQSSQQFLLETKLIRTQVDPATAFTNEFIKAEEGKY
jgi:NitT/TauT family transport system substrate-binding protein